MTYLDIVHIFSRKQDLTFHANCLNPMETICMKCQILFSEKNKKNIINLSSSELAKRAVTVKLVFALFQLMESGSHEPVAKSVSNSNSTQEEL